jgi:hypothetical protein
MKTPSFTRPTPKPAHAPAHDLTELLATLKTIEEKRATVLAQVLKREKAGARLDDDPPAQEIAKRESALSMLNGAAADLPRPRRGTTYAELLNQLATIDLAVAEGSRIASKLQMQAAEKRLAELAPDIKATMAAAAGHLFAAERLLQKYDSISQVIGFGMEKGAAVIGPLRLFNTSSAVSRVLEYFAKRGWVDEKELHAEQTKARRASGQPL